MTANASVPNLGSVVVTGVSSGIGRAITLELLDAGYTVFGSVRRLEDSSDLAADNARFIPLIFDVTDRDSTARAVTEVRARTGPSGLTALVNNAGINVSGPFLHQPEEQFRQVMDVNFHGLVEVTRAFLPLLGTTDTPRATPGRIINIGSVQGIMTVPFMTAYSASKHAVEAFAQGLRRELTPFGISVSTIEPNFTQSALFGKAAADLVSNRYLGTRYEAAWAQFNTSIAASEDKAKPASTVAKKVLHALQISRPKARYPMDPIWHIGRWLPDKAFDSLIFKALGIARMMRPTKAT
jgi:NAD(P)-dependent dehydrogenase (short-subunit alcohol dehydrogenase family)